MTSKKNNLNKEELDILRAFENEKTISVKEIKKEKSKAKQAATNTKVKTKPVNIRISVKDLNDIQKKAEQIGLPYQTLINLLVHHYNQGKIKLTI